MNKQTASGLPLNKEALTKTTLISTVASRLAGNLQGLPKWGQ
jgi:hypothetical protein